MPHNWASAEFIRLAIHLLALDRGNELHLFEGLPREWTKAGMRTELNGIATPFGPLSLKLQVSEDGKNAKLKIDALPDPSCQNIIVHLDSFRKDRKETINLMPGEEHNIDIQITL